MNTVWVGENIELYFFKEVNDIPVGMANPDKFNYASDANNSILAPCYTEKVSIAPSLDANRRPVTGRPALKIVQDNFTFTMTASNLYHDPQQFNSNLYFRSKSDRLRIVAYMFSDTRDYPYCFEQKILTAACIKDGSLEFQSDSNVIDSVTFWGEDLLSPALGL